LFIPTKKELPSSHPYHPYNPIGIRRYPIPGWLSNFVLTGTRVVYTPEFCPNVGTVRVLTSEF
jgi:hypothetical protein